MRKPAVRPVTQRAGRAYARGLGARGADQGHATVTPRLGVAWPAYPGPPLLQLGMNPWGEERRGDRPQMLKSTI